MINAMSILTALFMDIRIFSSGGSLDARTRMLL
jgi:hypothetical protein